MSDAFFELASDFMAVGPAGSAHWTAVNPALATRLGIEETDIAAIVSYEGSDRSRLRAADGSLLFVDWSVREVDGLAYWVGHERRAGIVAELHHRFKNHFQFVVSLLALQSTSLTDPGMRTQFAIAESRLRAVARLHETAYASANFSEIEFGGYLRQLVHSLAFGESVTVSIDACEVALPMEQAVLLALIAHEMIAGACRFKGILDVSLRYGMASLSLQVRHSAPAEEPLNGRELIDLLVEQLGGALYFHASGPQDVSVSFPLIDN